MGGPTNGGRSHSLRALQDSDELHRAVLLNISDAVFVTDPDGHFTFVCPNVDVIFGFVPDEVHAMGEIDKLLGENLFEPERLAAEGEIPNIEREITAKSGKRRTILIQIKKVSIDSGTVLYACRDITERKLTESKIRESEERFRDMANCAPVLLWMSGPDKLGVFFNQGWLTFRGRTLEQELGDGWVEGVHPDDGQHCLEICHGSFDKRLPFEVEYRLRRHDGEYRWVLDVGTPRFSPDGEFKGYIGYAVDISDRKQKEDNERIVAHLQRLAALGELAAAMAHELRQPLAASITNAEVAQSLLSAGNPPLEELRDIISEIFGANRRAAEVISRIRDLTIKGEPRIEPLDLNSAVSDAVRLIASETSRRRIRLHVEFADGLPLVLGDGVQLQQVLINLAMNGMDAMTNTPEQARHLTIETRQNGSGYVEVIVVDRGTGIAPDTLPHLFESFFTTKEGGLGLGLTISRSIIDRHRGRIWAENYPGGGAAFHFIVPVTKNRSATGTLNYQG